MDVLHKKYQNLQEHLGFRQVRVRIHGTIARIELLPEAFSRLLAEDVRKKVYSQLKSYGFTYVTLDLLGYRTGSMNETLEWPAPEATALESHYKTNGGHTLEFYLYFPPISPHLLELLRPPAPQWGQRAGDRRQPL